MSLERLRSPFREIFGWCMFDFANSSYTTVIISVVYCNVFTQIIVPMSSNTENPHQEGNFLWGISLAVSYMLVVFTGPIFGAISDFKENKKLFLFLSYMGCVILTALLYFVEPGMVWLGILCIIFSNFFFASGENFASSFLPFLGPKEDLGKISGYAWGIGYFGGIGSVLLATSLGAVDPENFSNLRWVGPYTAAFFFVAAIPTFLFLKEPKVDITPKQGIGFLRLAGVRVVNTLKDTKNFQDLLVYLVSLFFVMAGLGIVISFAFIYGSQEIGTESQHEQAMFVLIQVSAALGAVLFGFIQDKAGAKFTFNLTLFLWIIINVLIYFVRDLTAQLSTLWGTDLSVQWVFVGITSLAGLGLGATQSASRALVGLFSPEEKSGEFFGLWGFSGKVASAFGLVILAWLQTVLSLRNAFVVVGVFFAISLVINLFVNEKRGMQTARDYGEP